MRCSGAELVPTHDRSLDSGDPPVGLTAASAQTHQRGAVRASLRSHDRIPQEQS